MTTVMIPVVQLKETVKGEHIQECILMGEQPNL